MDDEIEDVNGEIKYTESQKSVTTSNVYSLDFTDSGSEKNNSSGKETYVIECVDSDDSDKYHVHNSISVVNLRDKFPCPTLTNGNIQSDPACHTAVATSHHRYSMIGQEIYTQTSKTILELAQTEGFYKSAGNKTLETQTSFISVTESKTVAYRVELSETGINEHDNIFGDQVFKSKLYNNTNNQVLTNELEDESSKFVVSEVEYTKSENSVEEIIKLLDEESKENMVSPEEQIESRDEHYENTSEFDISSQYDSDIEEDSLMLEENPRNKYGKTESNSDISEVPNSVDNEVAELYDKLSESIDLNVYENSTNACPRKVGALTPLTEESLCRSQNVVNITSNNRATPNEINDDEVLFTNDEGIKIKVLSGDKSTQEKDNLKLPPIHSNRSCPSSPQLNLLLSFNRSHNPITKSGTLPCLYEGDNEVFLDRWDFGTTDLAAGESTKINGRQGQIQRINTVHLPPIHITAAQIQCPPESYNSSNAVRTETNITMESDKESISINDKIKELKIINNRNRRSAAKPRYNSTNTEFSRSRSGSPRSDCSRYEERLCDVAERGCDVLCVQLLRRLKSPHWYEVPETLEELPNLLSKFWSVLSENRIADLLRQVTSLVESPRTQVARAACSTLAAILKHTNYTRKPDFYEAMTVLLIKTSSFNKPVRRAANVALDDVICNVEYTHAVTALCVHGVGHKSPLVRCASSRLLVVCTALAGGGRELLRARPPTAHAARKHALNALAALLDDKDCDTRKYAERLYAMLRPLPTFEAYYLNDVDVETATRQMKKCDKILQSGNKDTR